MTAAAAIADDLVLPFRTDTSGVTGRLVRLGPLVDQILSRHDYPEPVSDALGQAIALAALLGSAIKFNGKMILQTKSDGPLGFLVVDFESPGRLRGYAAFDAARTAELVATAPKDQGRLLGTGHMALTIDPGGRMDRGETPERTARREGGSQVRLRSAGCEGYELALHPPGHRARRRAGSPAIGQIAINRGAAGHPLKPGAEGGQRSLIRPGRV